MALQMAWQPESIAQALPETRTLFGLELGSAATADRPPNRRRRTRGPNLGAGRARCTLLVGAACPSPRGY